jgi:hypothetical protein
MTGETRGSRLITQRSEVQILPRYGERPLNPGDSGAFAYPERATVIRFVTSNPLGGTPAGGTPRGTVGTL